MISSEVPASAMMAKQDDPSNQSMQGDEEVRIGEEFRKAFIGEVDQKGLLAKRLAQALLEKTAEIIDNEVTCKIHSGLPLVAFDVKTERFGCQ